MTRPSTTTAYCRRTRDHLQSDVERDRLFDCAPSAGDSTRCSIRDRHAERRVCEVEGLWLHLHEAFPIGYAVRRVPEIGAFASAMIPLCAVDATPLRLNATLTYHGTAGEIWRGYSSANYVIVRSADPVPESTVVRMSLRAVGLDNGYCGENRYSHIGRCEDTSGGATNAYDRACTYTGFPGGYSTFAYCDLYDDEDFTALSMCCACGGGSLGDICIDCPLATAAQRSDSASMQELPRLSFLQSGDEAMRRVSRLSYVPTPGMTGTDWRDICL